MITVGSAVSELQQGQQFAGLLNMIFLLPLFLLMILFENPASPVFVLLSLFPPTAFLSLSLRWGLGSVPLWQVAVSWILLVSWVAFMVWVAARVFRIGMLSYGQPLKWKSILAALREVSHA
jgi:ABC-2 type transport system permease protein